tara:strand:- start:139759 stop:141546 length:1788 start_codon:yes stop_codon:yes gene_type:complete
VNKKTLSKKINLFIFLTFCVFGFVFVSFQIHHYLDIRSYYLTKVQKITQSISDSFHFYYHNVQNIALHESVIQGNYRESSRYFDSLIALYPDYEYIILTDKDGKVITMNSIGNDGKKLPYRALRKTDLSEMSWFKSLKSNEASNNIRKGIFGTHFESLKESEFAKEHIEKSVYGNHFSTSVIDDAGEVTGYITTFVNNNWIEAKVDLVDNVNSFMHKDLYVINGENQILGFVPKENILSELPFELKTSNLTQNLFAGDIIGVFKGVETFYQSPLFISSEFKHNNFLDQLQWKLILKINKLEFFKDFLFKFAGFFILFGIWTLFVKQLEFSFRKVIGQIDDMKDTEDLEKVAFYRKFYSKSFDSFKANVARLVGELEESKLEVKELAPYRPLDIEDPYEKYSDTASNLLKTKEAFLKYEVYTDNESFFAKELDSYMKRTLEDLGNTSQEIANLKREVLNLQVKHDISDASSQSMDLAISRVEMLLSDISRGLDNVSHRNNESRSKKSAGWAEFKNFVYDHLLTQVNKFQNLSEDQAFFMNNIKVYNSINQEKHMEKSQEIDELKKEISSLKKTLRELSELLEKENLSQDDLTEDAA